jgi:hypothetical protein
MWSCSRQWGAAPAISSCLRRRRVHQLPCVLISTPLANDPGPSVSDLSTTPPSVAEAKTLQKRRDQPLRIGNLRRDTTPRTRPGAHTHSHLSSSSPARRLRRRRSIPPLVRRRSSPAPSRSARGKAPFHTT